MKKKKKTNLFNFFKKLIGRNNLKLIVEDDGLTIRNDLLAKLFLDDSKRLEKWKR